MKEEWSTGLGALDELHRESGKKRGPSPAVDCTTSIAAWDDDDGEEGTSFEGTNVDKQNLSPETRKVKSTTKTASQKRVQKTKPQPKIKPKSKPKQIPKQVYMQTSKEVPKVTRTGSSQTRTKSRPEKEAPTQFVSKGAFHWVPDFSGAENRGKKQHPKTQSWSRPKSATSSIAFGSTTAPSASLPVFNSRQARNVGYGIVGTSAIRNSLFTLLYTPPENCTSEKRRARPQSAAGGRRREARSKQNDRVRPSSAGATKRQHPRRNDTDAFYKSFVERDEDLVNSRRILYHTMKRGSARIRQSSRGLRRPATSPGARSGGEAGNEEGKKKRKKKKKTDYDRPWRIRAGEDNSKNRFPRNRPKSPLSPSEKRREKSKNSSSSFYDRTVGSKRYSRRLKKEMGSMRITGVSVAPSGCGRNERTEALVNARKAPDLLLDVRALIEGGRSKNVK